MAGALSLGHGPLEIPLTMLGVTLLATGHWLNRRADCCKLAGCPVRGVALNQWPHTPTIIPSIEGDDLATAARDALLRGGEQWTEMRAQIFDALAGFDKPASAYDIAEAVSKARGKRVAANSVYRILDLFVANNLALRVESANAYLANAHPDCVHDCIFLVCDGCGHDRAYRRRQDRDRRPRRRDPCGLYAHPPGDRSPWPVRGVRRLAPLGGHE